MTNALALTLSMSVLAYWNSLLCELKIITGDKTMKTGLTKKDIAWNFAVAEDGELIGFLHKAKLSFCESHLPELKIICNV